MSLHPLPATMDVDKDPVAIPDQTDTLSDMVLGPPERFPGQTILDLPALTSDLPACPDRPEGAVRLLTGRELASELPRLETYMIRAGTPLSRHPGWPLILARGLGHVPYCLEARSQSGRTQGLLCLSYMRSLIFGRFLVSLPYLNYGGIIADDESIARRLVDRAVVLADSLNVRYLELRHEHGLEHPALGHKLNAKVNMHLTLPATAEQLWDGLSCKVRNQIRKGEKHGLEVVWGGRELLPEFYSVFSHNMRDLGTPVYSWRLFRSMFEQFPERVEFCSLRLGAVPVAAAVLLHGWGITEVPSASSLRAHNHTCANMLMYWHLLKRAVERRQDVFDFGRCSPDGNTFRFKKQWGAVPRFTEWQYYVRRGTIGELNPYNPRYLRYVQRWQRLPVWLTRLLGPLIVRGIP
jgi:FemAB-related protein (PEP-CTERM system-associated)